jgi:hypothetical protein
MRVVFRPEAETVLDRIAEFIDNINTDGSGEFWVEKFIAHIYTYALSKTSYALCHNAELASFGYSCINHNGWVVAFKIEGELLVVY